MPTSQTVSVQNASLHGDFLLRDSLPHCLALILPGSGPTDGDGNQPGLQFNNLRDLAFVLADQGVATLRIDKRGVGRSAAALAGEAQLTFDTYVEDAVQWVEWLQASHRQIPIVLLGHSEGALIATLAAKRIAISGVVALCAPARRASVVLRSQLKGKLPEHLAQASESILDALESGKVCPECPDELQILYRPSVRPYLRSWFQYDPQREAARLNCRYLWLWGDADKQLGPESIHLARSQASAIIPDMDHAMRMVSDPHRLHPEMIEKVLSFCSAS